MKTINKSLDTGLVCTQYKKANGVIAINVKEEDSNISKLRKLFKTFA